MSIPTHNQVIIRSNASKSLAETLVYEIVDPDSCTWGSAVFAGAEASSGLFDVGIASGLKIESQVGFHPAVHSGCLSRYSGHMRKSPDTQINLAATPNLELLRSRKTSFYNRLLGQVDCGLFIGSQGIRIVPGN